MIDLASEAVEWQGMALLDLAGGKTIAEVRETLGLDRAGTGRSRTGRGRRSS